MKIIWKIHALSQNRLNTSYSKTVFVPGRDSCHAEAQHKLPV